MTTLPIDGEKLSKIMGQKGYTQIRLAEEVGIAKSNISQYIAEKQEPNKAFTMAICMALGITYDDIKPKPKPQPISAVGKVLEAHGTSEEMKALNAKIDALSEDMGKLAAIILDIQKVSNEAKAQSQLNHDELQAIFNKVTDANSSINKCLGKLIHKY